MKSRYLYPNGEVKHKMNTRKDSILLGTFFLLLSMGFFYEFQFLGTTTAVIGVYLAVTLFSVFNIFYFHSFGRLTKAKLDLRSFLLCFLVIIFTIVFWMIHASERDVEIVEVHKAYVSTLVLLFISFLPTRFSGNTISDILEFYLNIAFLNSLFVLFQFLMLLTFGTFPKLPWRINLDPYYKRVYGFFMEPSYFGLYSSLICLLPNNIFTKNTKKIYVIIFSLIITFSNVALFSAFLILIRFLLFCKRYFITKILLLSFLILSIIIIIIVVIDFDIIKTSYESYENPKGFNRLNQLIISIKTRDPLQDKSLFYRFYSGILIMKYEDAARIIIGYGPGDSRIIASNYKGAEYYRLITRWPFMSGFTLNVLGYGLVLYIVLALFIIFNIGLLGFLILVVLSLFDAKAFYNPIFICLYFLALLIRKSNMYTKIKILYQDSTFSK